MSQAPNSLGEKLQSLPKPALYLVLIILTSVPLFVTVHIPNKPAQASVDFFNLVEKLPPDKPILIQTDWTTSTRGESAGQFKSLMRILMRKNIKFCFYSAGDPQAPQVARDYIEMVNAERKLKGERQYERWNDYIVAGYFPSAEAISNSITNNFRTAFQDKKDKNPDGVPTPIFDSPVLANIQKVSDFSAMLIVTGSNTSNVAIERIKHVPLAMMVTGVMGPETQVYYDSHQLKGLVTGLKGLYDMENLMEDEPTYKGEVNLDNGAKYYPTLHIALILMILAIVIGNVGMFLSRKRSA